jgi:polyhydroxyalkanoate synthesis regulator phasin
VLGRTKVVLIGLVVLVLLAAGIGGTLVLAQGPTTTPTAPAASTTPTPTAPATSGTPTPSAPRTLSDLYWQALAQRLGLSVDKLQQTIVDARKDAINQAVKQGLLTQAQADRLLQQLQNAVPGTVFDNFGRGRAVGQVRDVATSIRNAGLDAAAKTLGMSTNDLTIALRGGKTLLVVTREKNVDVTKLRTAIADAEKAAVDQAVKDGKLTQAQADSIKANLTPDNIDLNTRSLNVPFPGGFNPGLTPGQRNGRPFPGRGNGRGFARP